MEGNIRFFHIYTRVLNRYIMPESMSEGLLYHNAHSFILTDKSRVVVFVFKPHSWMEATGQFHAL